MSLPNCCWSIFSFSLKRRDSRDDDSYRSDNYNNYDDEDRYSYNDDNYEDSYRSDDDRNQPRPVPRKRSDQEPRGAGGKSVGPKGTELHYAELDLKTGPHKAPRKNKTDQVHYAEVEF